MSMSDQEQRIRQEGMRASMAGAPWTWNPHPYGSPWHKQWHEGWQSAEDFKFITVLAQELAK